MALLYIIGKCYHEYQDIYSPFRMNCEKWLEVAQYSVFWHHQAQLGFVFNVDVSCWSPKLRSWAMQIPSPLVKSACHCEHASMLASSSKHCCTFVQPKVAPVGQSLPPVMFDSVRCSEQKTFMILVLSCTLATQQNRFFLIAHSLNLNFDWVCAQLLKTVSPLTLASKLIFVSIPIGDLRAFDLRHILYKLYQFEGMAVSQPIFLY